MASDQRSLLSTKLFLASRLMSMRAQAQSRADQEACWQGAAELAVRARSLLLETIAGFYQHKKSKPENLEALIRLVGEEASEVQQLQELAVDSSSWWQQISRIEKALLSADRSHAKPIEDNMIMAVDTTTDPRSPELIQRAIADLKHFLESLAERHDEF